MTPGEQQRNTGMVGLPMVMGATGRGPVRRGTMYEVKRVIYESLAVVAGA